MRELGWFYAPKNVLSIHGYKQQGDVCRQVFKQALHIELITTWDTDTI